MDTNRSKLRKLVRWSSKSIFGKIIRLPIYPINTFLFIDYLAFHSFFYDFITESDNKDYDNESQEHKDKENDISIRVEDEANEL